MKKYYGYLLLFFMLLLSCSKSNRAFYDKVLSDFGTRSYFIALDIKSDFYKGRVLIENNDLYNFLNKTKGWDKERYKARMLKILAHKEHLIW